VIYVDSGSQDDSVAMARAMGVDVVELSGTSGFTAARARNAGLERLRTVAPQVKYVQFVDGDCEVDPRWMPFAELALNGRSDVAIVCGRRRERYPDASIYNRLCDLEWNTTPGEATECGGDAMMRVDALTAADGYNPTLIAGEEPELCVRLRLAGWKILRLDAEMTLHDAAMTRFSQWWKRNLRAGYAFAEGAFMHGKSSTRHWVTQTRRNWMWGAVLPLAAVLLAWPTFGISIVALAGLYGMVTFKVFRWQRSRGTPASQSALYAIFCTLSKFAQVAGQIRFTVGRVLQRKATLIEYKTPIAAQS
jgi:glycosyltransferase involved in cell wall biosynthesis